MVTADFSKIPMQAELINTVLQEIANYKNGIKTENAPRIFVIHGSIRGGKSYVCLGAVALLLKAFPGTRCTVLRKSVSDLKRTTVSSAKKMFASSDFKWKNSADDLHVRFRPKDGLVSTMNFMSESYDTDKDLDRFKGLETNFFLLDQVEELHEDTFNKCIERAGSWVPSGYDKAPPPFIFITFNPTDGWAKKKLYEPYLTSKPEPGFKYLEALQTENPWVSEEQREGWKRMDSDSYNRFVKAEWDRKIKDQFMYSYSSKNKTSGLTLNRRFDLWLSFDFNVDPMTCVVFQTNEVTWLHVVKEFRIENSGTYEMCEAIENWLGPDHGFVLQITGDGTGDNRNTTSPKTNYMIIRDKLGIRKEQLHLERKNPKLSWSRTVCNSILENFPSFLIDVDQCPSLDSDMKYVLTGRNNDGEMVIMKKGVNQYCNIDNAKLGHLMDCLRYGIHATVANWVKFPKP